MKNVGELKTKPTQHAVARLREIGIVPDFIITRNEIPIDRPRIETIARRCFVLEEDIIDDPDIDLIYKVPLIFEEKKFAEKILKKFGIKKTRKSDLKEWRCFVNQLEKPKDEVKIALVGKYVTHGAQKHKDVYVSVLEAVNHAAAACQIKVRVLPIDSARIEKEGLEGLKGIEGLIVPQGWGSRETEGKIMAIQLAREKKLPCLGLCFGMQMAVIEFGRHVVNLAKANSTEVDPKTPHPVIHIMPDQKKYLEKQQYGGTIRLGSWPCRVKKGTRLWEAYQVSSKSKVQSQKLVVQERHRHRYEFNNKYRERFERAGMVFSGTSPDGKLVEAIEIPDHPFFVGTQFHPEYKSRPLSPHPIFVGLVRAVFERKRMVK